MQKFLLLALVCMTNVTIQGQDVFFEGGNITSTFDYKNSTGNKLENLRSTNHGFWSLGYRDSFLTKDLFFDVRGYYNNYGAIGSDVALDNYFEWDLSYVGAGFGLDYEVYKLGRFIFYLKASGSVEFMVKGTQIINDQVYSLLGEEDFDSPYYFLRAGLGSRYKISDRLAVFAEYMYGRGNGFNDVQGDLKINAHSFGIGVAIALNGGSKTLPEQDTAVMMPMDMGNLEEDQRLESLEQELNQKEEEIAAQEVEILALKEVIVTQEEEILEKEEVIALQEEEIKTLQEIISTALKPYTDKGIAIHERDGKIYITMENDMLFEPGKWEISDEGQMAVNELGNVLADNPEVTVLIEGHTDNQPLSGKGKIKDNWELSTKRATTVVELLRKNKNINPKNLTAAGRGEYDPIADNATPEGRAKNRRIEVILTPQLKGMLEHIDKEK